MPWMEFEGHYTRGEGEATSRFNVGKVKPLFPGDRVMLSEKKLIAPFQRGNLFVTTVSRVFVEILNDDVASGMSIRKVNESQGRSF